MDVSAAFAKALRTCRQKKGLTQEDFGIASSRTYISTLERELKSPTLEKIQDIAKVMDISPLTLLCIAYFYQSGEKDIGMMLAKAAQEAQVLLSDDK